MLHETYIEVLRVLLAAKRVAKVGANAGRHISFVALMVSLILEQDKLVGLVIGAIVGQVGHFNKIITLSTTHPLNLTNNT